MFYRCPNLRVVVIPTNGKIFDRVVVIGSPIRYMEVANEIGISQAQVKKKKKGALSTIKKNI